MQGVIPPLGSQQFFDSPYDTYAVLRAEDPVHWDEGQASWLVTRYHDVVAGLEAKELSSKRSRIDRLPTDAQARLGELRNFYSRWLMFSDGAQHASAKQTVGRAITQQLMQRVVQGVRQKAADEIEAMRGREQIDIVRDFALPLATYAVCLLVGVDLDARQVIGEWARHVVAFLGAPALTLEQGETAQRAAQELTEYLKKMARTEATEPARGVLQSIPWKTACSSSTDEDVLLAVVANILVDGHEPISAAVSSGLLLLLKFPDQQHRVAHEPGTVGAAVEEVFRYESPFQYAARVAADDMSICGRKIVRGQRVMFMLGSANRDASVFPSPDAFDVARVENRHIAFGHGSHSCVAAPFARRMTRELLDVLIPTLRHLSVAEGCEWERSIGYRRLHTLPVTWR